MVIYDNGFRQNHSKFLLKLFHLSQNGIDYYNQYNIGFEFKECFANIKTYYRYKLPKEQLEKSDIIVFCFNNKEFYLVKSYVFLKRYKFNNNSCCIALSTVRKFAFFRTFDIVKLKDKIEKYQK